MVIIALAVTMLSTVVATVFEVMHYGMLADLDRGIDLSYETVEASDIRLLAGNAFQSLCFICVSIAFLVWFDGAYRNLRRLRVGPLRFDAGWAVGAWFIPGFNLWRPKQIANDVWRGSEPTPGAKRLDAQGRVAFVIHVWWVSWVVACVLTAAEIAVDVGAQTLPEQKAATALGIASNGAYLLCGLLAILAVWRTTKRQSKAIAAAFAADPALRFGWVAPPPGFAPPWWGAPLGPPPPP